MNTDLIFKINQRKRQQESPTWKILAAHSSPIVLTLLDVHLNGRTTPCSGPEFHQQIELDLASLREAGVPDIPSSSARELIARWLYEGWITRRFPKESKTELYQTSGKTPAFRRGMRAS